MLNGITCMLLCSYYWALVDWSGLAPQKPLHAVIVKTQKLDGIPTVDTACVHYMRPPNHGNSLGALH